MLNLLFIPTYFSLGIFNVALIDVIVLVLAIIAGIIGYSRGFMQQVLSFFGKIACFLIAYFFCASFASFICSIIPAIPQGLESWLEGVFGAGLNGDFNSKAQIMEVLKNSSIPTFLHEALANAVVNSDYSLKLIPIISQAILNVASFILVYFLSKLGFVILRKLFKSITSIPVIKYFDKTFGVLFSLLMLTVISTVAIIILSLFLPINDYLKPDEAFCVYNAVIEYIMNLEFSQKIIAFIT